MKDLKTVAPNEDWLLRVLLSTGSTCAEVSLGEGGGKSFFH
jgi:hypothetical protein